MSDPNATVGTTAAPAEAQQPAAAAGVSIDPSTIINTGAEAVDGVSAAAKATGNPIVAYVGYGAIIAVAVAAVVAIVWF